MTKIKHYIKTTKKESKIDALDLMVSGTVFTPVAQRKLIKETDYQNQDNFYANIKALKNDMRTLGHQNYMLITIKPKKDEYEAIVYLPRKKINHKF